MPDRGGSAADASPATPTADAATNSRRVSDIVSLQDKKAAHHRDTENTEKPRAGRIDELISDLLCLVVCSVFSVSLW
jgi:hypothetical protein